MSGALILKVHVCTAKTVPKAYFKKYMNGYFKLWERILAKYQNDPKSFVIFDYRNPVYLLFEATDKSLRLVVRTKLPLRDRSEKVDSWWKNWHV